MSETRSVKLIDLSDSNYTEEDENNYKPSFTPRNGQKNPLFKIDNKIKSNKQFESNSHQSIYKNPRDMEHVTSNINSQHNLSPNLSCMNKTNNLILKQEQQQKQQQISQQLSQKQLKKSKISENRHQQSKNNSQLVKQSKRKKLGFFELNKRKNYGSNKETKKHLKAVLIMDFIRHKIKPIVENISTRKYNYILQNNGLEKIYDLAALDIEKENNSIFLEKARQLIGIFECVIKWIMKKIIIRTLNPNKKWVTYFSFFEVLSILVLMFVYSLYIFYGFEDQYYMIRFQIWGLLIFSTGTFLRLNLGYYESGNYIYDRDLIYQRYQKLYQWYDILSMCAIVYSMIDFNAGGLHEKILVLPIFAKSKIMIERIIEIVERMNLSGYQVYVWQMLGLCFQTMLICHITGCLYVLLANIEIYNFNFTNSWIQVQNLENAEWYKLYMESFYWALATIMLIGSKGNTFAETFFVCVTLFATVGVFATIIANIQIILEDIAKKSKGYRKDLEVLNQLFESNKNISKNTQAKLLNYLKYSYIGHKDMRASKDLESVLQKFPENLQESVKKERYRYYLSKIDFLMKNLTKKGLEDIISIIQEEYFMPNEQIFQKDDNKEPKLYLIMKGNVEIYQTSQQIKIMNKKDIFKSLKILTQNSEPPNHNKENLQTIKQSMYKNLQKQLHIQKTQSKHLRDNIHLCNLSQDQYFGEYSFFSELSLPYKAKSIDFTTILTIKRSDILVILENQDMDTFHEVKHHLMVSNDSRYLSKKCFKCGKLSHQTYECNVFHYNPNKLNLIFKHNYYKPQQYRLKLREVNPDKPQRRKKFKMVVNKMESLSNNVDRIFENQNIFKSIICLQRMQRAGRKNYLKIHEKFDNLKENNLDIFKNFLLQNFHQISLKHQKYQCQKEKAKFNSISGTSSSNNSNRSSDSLDEEDDFDDDSEFSSNTDSQISNSDDNNTMNVAQNIPQSQISIQVSQQDITETNNNEPLNIIKSKSDLHTSINIESHSDQNNSNLIQNNSNLEQNNNSTDQHLNTDIIIQNENINRQKTRKQTLSIPQQQQNCQQHQQQNQNLFTNKSSNYTPRKSKPKIQDVQNIQNNKRMFQMQNTIRANKKKKSTIQPQQQQQQQHLVKQVNINTQLSPKDPQLPPIPSQRRRSKLRKKTKIKTILKNDQSKQFISQLLELNKNISENYDPGISIRAKQNTPDKRIKLNSIFDSSQTSQQQQSNLNSMNNESIIQNINNGSQLLQNIQNQLQAGTPKNNNNLINFSSNNTIQKSSPLPMKILQNFISNQIRKSTYNENKINEIQDSINEQQYLNNPAQCIDYHKLFYTSVELSEFDQMNKFGYFFPKYNYDIVLLKFQKQQQKQLQQQQLQLALPENCNNKIYSQKNNSNIRTQQSSSQNTKSTKKFSFMHQFMKKVTNNKDEN